MRGTEATGEATSQPFQTDVLRTTLALASVLPTLQASSGHAGTMETGLAVPSMVTEPPGIAICSLAMVHRPRREQRLSLLAVFGQGLVLTGIRVAQEASLKVRDGTAAF